MVIAASTLFCGLTGLPQKKRDFLTFKYSIGGEKLPKIE
jgi:hypothetical protein